MLNLHEDERSKPTSWIPVGWMPHYDPTRAPDRPTNRGFESHPTRQNEIFHACFRALLSEFSDCEPEAEVIPWGDGINRVTVFRLGGIIGDQQEADRATSQGAVCHRCVNHDFLRKLFESA